jgi:hypothetical protein
VNFAPETNRTYLQDDLFVKNRAFSHDIDMSKDPTMYPCASKNYIIEFYYAPRIAPPHIQDKFGWNGEGMKDALFSNTDIRGPMSFSYNPIPQSDESSSQLAPVTINSPGQRVFYTTLKLTQDQLLCLGEWAHKTPVVQTSNFKTTSSATDKDEIIKVPALRSQ